MIIANRIANMLMDCERIPFEVTEKGDSEQGFSESFKDYHEKWERHSFEVPSGDIVINGEYVINPNCPENIKKVIVLCHGQTVTRAGIIKYGKIFYDMGYHLVLFDERSFGKTTGRYCTVGYKEHEDIFHVVEYARSIFGEDCFLGLLGESMGAGSSLWSLEFHTPDFIVADCPFADTGILIRDQARQVAGFLGTLAIPGAERICLKRYPGYSFNYVKPIEAVKGTKVPICFMHGSADMLIDCKHSRMMYDLCDNPLSEIHLFDNTDHARSIYNYPQLYKELLEAFVKKIEKSKNIN